MPVNSQIRVYQHAAYTFDMIIYDIFTTLIHGGTVCVPSQHDRLHRLSDSIDQLRANLGFFTPTLLSTLHPSEVPSLATILLAGEPVSQELVNIWADKVCLLSSYGSTEMSTCFLTRLTGSEDSRTIGFPLGVIAHLVDPEKPEIVSHLDTGELVVTGPIIAEGYLNDEERTAQQFWTDQGSQFRSFRTGDIVRRSKDGGYVFLGRKDTLVKIRGMRVELGEVEHQLMSHPSVEKAVVLYPLKGEFDEKLTAIVQLSCGDKIGELETLEQIVPVMQRQLSAHVERGLPKYMVPCSWLSMPRIALTSSGKIDRKTISSMVENQLIVHCADKNQPRLAPQMELYPSPPISNDGLGPTRQTHLLDSSFLDLGLDSINLIGLSKILKKAYNINCDVASLGLLSLRTVISMVPGLAEGAYADADATRMPAHHLSTLFSNLYQQLSHIEPLLDASNIRPSPLFAEQPLKVLLTGATGFVGPYLLQALLGSLPSQRTIIALVRASSATEGLQRVIGACTAAKVTLSADQIDRIEIWRGDLSRPDLGLTPAQWSLLRADDDNAIDTIIHSGAIVDWSRSYEALEASNVLSTLTLLKCSMGRVRPLKIVYVSGGRSLEIATTPELALPCSRTIKMCNREARLEIQKAFDTIEEKVSLVGYDVSKLISEALVLSSAHLVERSIPFQTARTMHVIRPGYIIGNATTGYVNPGDYIWRVVATALRLRKRCFEPDPSWLYIAGVDHVARCIISPISHMDNLCSAERTQHNVACGVRVQSFWTAASTVLEAELQPVPSSEWLRKVEEDVANGDQEQHPLYPLLDAHRADSGLLGIQSKTLCECRDDEEVIKCLTMSLRYLLNENETFRSWIYVDML